jgi:hypothetical protein
MMTKYFEVYVVQENGENMKSFLSREEAEAYALKIDDGYDTDISIKIATWRNDND